jgi:hypothetical protein
VSGQSQQVSVAENGTEQKPGDGVALPSGVDAAASDPEWQTGLAADAAPDMESNVSPMNSDEVKNEQEAGGGSDGAKPKRALRGRGICVVHVPDRTVCRVSSQSASQ